MKVKLERVVSFSHLRKLAGENEYYVRLARLAAQNLGASENESSTLEGCMRVFELNAMETNSEKGVVGEINFCRDLV